MKKIKINEYKMHAVDVLATTDSLENKGILEIWSRSYSKIIIKLCNEIEELRAVRVEPKRTEIDPSQIVMVSDHRQVSSFSAKEIEKFWLWANDSVMSPEEALFHFANNVEEKLELSASSYEAGYEDGSENAYDDIPSCIEVECSECGSTWSEDIVF